MAGLGISRGGIVAQPAGGGGAPPGDATIWPAVADWAALSTVAGPLRDGDQVGVSDLGTPASIGVAQYDEANAEWALLFGWFNSFADMTAFAEPIITGALAAVEVSANNDETAVRYQYESGWARTATNQPYVWASTDPTAINNTDPSGIGVTRVGDILRITLANGTRDFRLRAFTTAGGDIVNANVWVPSELLESGTIKLWSFLVGTEASRAGSGFTDATSGAGSTITGDISSSGYTRLLAGATGAAQLSVTGLSLAAGQQIYFRMQMRGTAVGTFATAGLFVADGANVTQPIMNNSGVFQFSTIAGAALNANTLRSGGAALPNTSSAGELIELHDEGLTVLASLYRSGGLYHTVKRNQITLANTLVGFSTANVGTLDVRYVIAITRTPP
jgi:hypothetical protein